MLFKYIGASGIPHHWRLPARCGGSGQPAANRPEADRAEGGGGGDEDRELAPLELPVTAAWLVGHELVVGRADPGDAVVQRLLNSCGNLGVRAPGPSRGPSARVV